jgi:hypothetical protein
MTVPNQEKSGLRVQSGFLVHIVNRNDLQRALPERNHPDSAGIVAIHPRWSLRRLTWHDGRAWPRGVFLLIGEWY